MKRDEEKETEDAPEIFPLSGDKHDWMCFKLDSGTATTEFPDFTEFTGPDATAFTD